MIGYNVTILSQMSFFLEFFNVFFYTFIVVKQWDFFPTIYAPENGSLLHLDFKADVSTDFSMFFGSFSFSFVNEIVNSDFCSFLNEPKSYLGAKSIFSFL